MHQVLDRGAGASTAATNVHVGVRNLVKSFGSFIALKGISLDVRNGELICFLGPSGCGKTTLLRVIAGLDRQQSGAIMLAGRDVSLLPPAQRDFGIVFQSYALFPNLKVTDNIGYGLVNRHKRRAEITARVTELLELVGLQDQGDKYPVQLSGGQQQRVALARALATSPSLLLLDEPLSALDARVRVNLRAEIKQLQRRLGITTVLVTHDQEEALSMADRIVVMNHGVIEQVGTPEEVYARPATSFVAQFVGEMNFLPATIASPGSVTLFGITLRCGIEHELPAGTIVRLGLRPEEVRVRGVAVGAPNVLTARVVQLDYLGAFCRTALALVDHQDARIIADFSANAVRDLDIHAGMTLPVMLPPEVIRVFSAAQGLAA